MITENTIAFIQITGAIIAYILLILKLKEYYHDRIRLKVEVGNGFCKLEDKKKKESNAKFKIIIDVKNKGLQPTTISRVMFWFQKTHVDTGHSLGRNGVWMHLERKKFPVRVKPNDTAILNLIHIKEKVQTSQKLIKGSLEIHTTHKILNEKVNFLVIQDPNMINLKI